MNGFCERTKTRDLAEITKRLERILDFHSNYGLVSKILIISRQGVNNYATSTVAHCLRDFDFRTEITHEDARWSMPEECKEGK